MGQVDIDVCVRIDADAFTGQPLADYHYHGRLFSDRVFPNGLTYGFGYNDRKQMLEIRTYRGTDFTDNSKLVVGHRYQYDPMGLVSADLDLTSQKQSQLYYDSLYRQNAEVRGFDPANPTALPENGSWTTFDRLGNPVRIESDLKTSFGGADASLNAYVKYWKTCQTLPGELGLGLWMPVIWTSAVGTLTTLYMSGAIARGAGVSIIARLR